MLATEPTQYFRPWCDVETRNAAIVVDCALLVAENQPPRVITKMLGHKYALHADYVAKILRQADALPKKQKVPNVVGAVIYAVRAETGLIWVGATSRLRQHFTTLQASSPVSLAVISFCATKLARRLEQRLHGELQPYRSHGKWFRPSSPVTDAIARHITKGSRP